MIISDRYRFVFVHIPKCAGTSVRKPLREFNEWKHAGPPWQSGHAMLGMLDYGHIPLFTLHEYFEVDYNKVKDYWSLSVVRDPYSRFRSSISQRLKMYHDRPIQSLSLKEVERETHNAIDFLAGQPRHLHLLPAEYIHFQKQVDYICLDGEQVVDTIYPIERIDALLKDVGSRVGDGMWVVEDKAAPKANRTIVYRNDTVRRVIDVTRPATRFLRKFLPENTKRYIRSKIHIDRDDRLREIFCKDYVQCFIREYYAEDIQLVNRINGGKRGDLL